MTQDISMVRGSTQIFEISVTDANDNAYKLNSGEQLIFGVKKNYYDDKYLLKKKLTSANVADIEGVYTLKLVPEDTASIQCGEYCYDIGLQIGTDYYPVIECSHFKIGHNVTSREG